jgi:hypothetical protein
MPVIFREGGFRFFFYSNEGDPREPMHVHVMRDRDEAKFWLYPTPHIAYKSWLQFARAGRPADDSGKPTRRDRTGLA